jgi:hypothetical protein
VELALQDSSGATWRPGRRGAGHPGRVIGHFVAPTAGTYYARVGGESGVTYSLVVTRNAAFDAGGNGTFAAAQDITGTRGVLGALPAGSPSAEDWYAVAVTDANPNCDRDEHALRDPGPPHRGVQPVG